MNTNVSKTRVRNYELFKIMGTIYNTKTRKYHYINVKPRKRLKKKILQELPLDATQLLAFRNHCAVRLVQQKALYWIVWHHEINCTKKVRFSFFSFFFFFQKET